MQTIMNTKTYVERRVWFSMWFLGAVVTFGVAILPMFHRLIEGRNGHFQREVDSERLIVEYLKGKGGKPPSINQPITKRNAKLWAVGIILIIPVFIIVYYLSKDLVIHEQNQNRFLAAAFPKRLFMPQTIPIKKYALITIVTLGVGIIYWLYKVVNSYNAHYKAHLHFEKEISRLMGEEKNVECL